MTVHNNNASLLLEDVLKEINVNYKSSCLTVVESGQAELLIDN